VLLEQQKYIFKNQFSAEECMSRNQKTGNQRCTEASVDKWKSTSAWYRYMRNRH